MTSVSSKQAALLQVLDERGAGLIGVLAVDFDVVNKIFVLIPGFVIELDEADAAFHHAAGEKAVVGEGRFAGHGAVHIEDALRLFGQIHQFRRAAFACDTPFQTS